MTRSRRQPWWADSPPGISRHPWLAVACPDCGQPAGQRCYDRKGRLFCPARREAAYAKNHPRETRP